MRCVIFWMAKVLIEGIHCVEELNEQNVSTRSTPSQNCIGVGLCSGSGLNV